ncbi:hypothetical protein ACQ4WX_38080 [Streptomyces lasalocidi]
MATIHPSAVLRADDADRTRIYDGLVDDLRIVARLMADGDETDRRAEGVPGVSHAGVARRRRGFCPVLCSHRVVGRRRH